MSWHPGGKWVEYGHMFRFTAVLISLLAYNMILLAMEPVPHAVPFAPLPQTAVPAGASDQPPLVDAAAGILIDRQTGLVLWSQNPDVELPMASTTKIMTAMVILDHGANRLNEQVRVSKNAASAGGSYIFHEGDVTSLYNLLVERWCAPRMRPRWPRRNTWRAMSKPSWGG